MTSSIRIVAGLALLLAASVCAAVERVEIVLDASSDMWNRLGDGPPRFVVVRGALQDYAAASLERQGRPEVAIRLAGGSIPLGDEGWCDDTRLVANFGLINPEGNRQALADVVPRGGRPLVQALAHAVTDLDGADGRRRIVVITSGADQCHTDIISTITSIVSADPPIEVRIIGLGLDPRLAAAATTLAPTRNLTSATQLPDAVEWALQPADSRPAVARPVELHFTLGGRPLDAPAIELTDESGGERAFSAVEAGTARLQMKPGRYRAEIDIRDRPEIDLAGIVVGGSDQPIAIDLSDAPPVTLDISPEQPDAGNLAQIGYWGAPDGITWIALAMPGSAVGTHLVRARSGPGRGDVILKIPESFSELEARFIFEPLPGVSQLLGSRRFEIRPPQAELECDDKVENGKPLRISWTGPGNDGDRIMIAARGADVADWSSCFPADSATGSVTTSAPAVPGDYTVVYRSGLGRILAGRPLDVFEILATLDGPGSVGPDESFEVAWTGPDAAQDFLSIAAVGSPDGEYVSWTPTAEGSPSQLFAPSEAGSYEVRYVRSSDGSVLARRVFEVIESHVELGVPRRVASGTRFTVRWSGTARTGDFIAVAKPGSAAGDWLDFAFVVPGSPATLAAPYETGAYEVRYISGSDLDVLASAPLAVK